MDAIAAAIKTLQDAGIHNAPREAMMLLASVLGQTREQLLMEGNPQLNDSQQVQLQALSARRANHEPMSHILGVREFYGREFIVNSDVLDPRPDTETLIDAVLDQVKHKKHLPLTILDLGTGSGCILLTLLSELPQATGVGVDISEAALAVAERNARKLGVAVRATLKQGDFAAKGWGLYDIVVANPPYIPTSHIEGLMHEVVDFEPNVALDGGKDGLDCYRKTAIELPNMLAPNGFAALEVGSTQASDVAELFTAAGLILHAIKKDLAGHARCIVLTKQLTESL